MTELTPEKRAELRAKAEAATPGPLRVTLGARIHEERTISREDDHIDIIACHVPPNDADFMAAFDRETCLALLDAAEERDRLRAEVDDLRDCYQSAHDPKSVGNIAWLAERFREGMDLAKAENAKLHEQVKRLRRFVAGNTGCCCLTFADGTDTSDQCIRCRLLVATAPKEATS